MVLDFKEAVCGILVLHRGYGLGRGFPPHRHLFFATAGSIVLLKHATREDAIVTVAAAYLENLQDAEGNSQERVLVLVHSEILPEKRECWLTSFRRPCGPADTRTSRRSQESHQARISRRASS